MIVVETNVVAYHLLRTEPFAAEVGHLAEKDPDWVAPTVLRSELRNLLALQHRETTLSIEEAKHLAEQAEALFENALLEVETKTILDLVAQSDLSAYRLRVRSRGSPTGVPSAHLRRSDSRLFSGHCAAADLP